MIKAIAIAITLAFTLPAFADEAQQSGSLPHCSKGQVCGHSCISKEKICRRN